MAHPRIESWFDFAPGQKLDPDLSYGLQCVDAVDHYGQYLFGVSWQTCVGAVPLGARQLFDVMPAKYWIKVRNDPTSNTLPPRGAVGVFDGFGNNPFGHTLIFESPRLLDFDALQQDGFAPPLQFVNGGWYSAKPTHRATYRWPGLPGGFPGRLIGWCIPREELITPAPKPKTILDGVDISAYQPTIRQAQVPAEFVIVKTTGGAHYTNPYFQAQLKDARADGALVGVYHFLRDGGYNTTARQEAEHFLAKTAGQIDDRTIVVLDFEHASLLASGQPTAASVQFAKDWADIVRARLGKSHVIFYMNLSVANSRLWRPIQDTGQNKLWLAQYPTNARQTGYGPKGTRGVPYNWHVVMWQYTQAGRLAGYGGDLDLNQFYGNETTWNLYAAPAAATPAGGFGAADADFDKFQELLMSFYKNRAEFETRMLQLLKQNNATHISQLLNYHNTGRTKRSLYALIIDAGLNSTEANVGVRSLLAWIKDAPANFGRWVWGYTRKGELDDASQHLHDIKEGRIGPARRLEAPAEPPAPEEK
jgi:lysozyme